MRNADCGLRNGVNGVILLSGRSPLISPAVLEFLATAPRLRSLQSGPRTDTSCTVSHIVVTSLRSKWAVGKARGGSISESIRNRRATPPPAHFQRNPPGRGRLAVFPRCSLLTSAAADARRSRLEKQ